MSRLMIVNCPRCWHADEVTAVRAPDAAGFIYTCDFRDRHDDGQPHLWQQDPESSERAWSGGEGVLDDLYDPLLAVFLLDDPFLEHGVVEARLRQTAPAVFARHVEEAGHVAFGAIRNTASNRIAMALGVLRAQGRLADRRAPGTGGWSYNQDIGFWRLAPAPLGTPLLTWADHCAALGRDSEFTDEDRLGLTSQRQAIAAPWQADHARLWDVSL